MMIRLRPARPHLVLWALVLCLALLVVAPAAVAIDTGLIAFQGVRRFEDGKRIEKDVYTMAPNGSGVKRLGDGFQPTISRDGKKIAFVAVAAEPEPGQEPEVEIFTMNADGSNVHRVTNDESTNSEPAFSPDGKQIVFVGDRRVNGKSLEFPKIFVVDVDGSNERQLTKGKSLDLEPSFSPDGSRITFIRGPGESRLMTMTAGGGDLTTLTKFKDPFSTPTSPSYSPNGKRILFQGFEDGKNRIYAFDAADGGNLVTLTKGDGEGVEPAYSPDGSSIVFRRGVNLFTMDADGANVNQLTSIERENGSNVRPSWGR
jgi:TolB protein